jgi:hypothetical protein
MVGRVWPRHGHRGRPLNSVVRHHMAPSRVTPPGWTIWVVGGIAATVHVAICFVVAQHPSEGSWQWFPVFVLDFPFSIAIEALSPKGSEPLATFGLFGSLWWLFLGAGIASIFRRWVGSVATSGAHE